MNIQLLRVIKDNQLLIKRIDRIVIRNYIRGNRILLIKPISFYINKNNIRNELQQRRELSESSFQKISSFFSELKSVLRTSARIYAETLFDLCKTQALQDDWYARGKAPVNYRSKIILFTMHIWMINRKLLASKESNPWFVKTQEILFDRFWEFTVPILKGLKLYSTNKGLEQTQLFAFHICQLFDEAVELETDDEKIDAIAGVIWNYLFNRQDIAEEHVLEIARYIYHQYLHLLSLEDEKFLYGEFKWNPIPTFKDLPQRIRAGQGRESRKWPDNYAVEDKESL